MAVPRRRDCPLARMRPALPIDGQMCAGGRRQHRRLHPGPAATTTYAGYLRERLYEYLGEGVRLLRHPLGRMLLLEDRGDGALIVVPPGNFSVKGLIDPLPGQAAPPHPPAQPRLEPRPRTCSCGSRPTSGPVEHDRHGFVGTDVNFAFRMLDARSLKAKLAKSGAELGLIVCDDVLLDKLIRRCPSPGRPRSAFQAVSSQTKNTPGPGPGPTCPARHANARRPGRPHDHDDHVKKASPCRVRRASPLVSTRRRRRNRRSASLSVRDSALRVFRGRFASSGPAARAVRPRRGQQEIAVELAVLGQRVQQLEARRPAPPPCPRPLPGSARLSASARARAPRTA